MRFRSLILSAAAACMVFGSVGINVYGEEAAPATDTATDAAADAQPEQEPYVLSQGIVKISSALDNSFVLDDQYCTFNNTDNKLPQLFRSQDVNQQRFYLEALSDGTWRISAVHTGDALTASDSNILDFDAMVRNADGSASQNQSWIIEAVGDGSYLISSMQGAYMSADTKKLYNGTPLVLRGYTGLKDQRWYIEPAWVSPTGVCDTDHVNPYDVDGKAQNLYIALDCRGTLEVLDSATLLAHTVETEDHQYVLEEDFISSYVQGLADKYDTLGTPQTFVTTDKRTLTITEGNYGWQMDVSSTIAEISKYLDTGYHKKFTPVWSSEHIDIGSNSDDNFIGNSYVEVDLTAQKVWLYKDGQMLLETDCVSGTKDTSRETVTGAFYIYRKQSPATLTGADYVSYVDFWMPFYRGYGLHNAGWRSQFGGDIYTYSGSHGCVNLSYEAAETIYNNVVVGYPVIVYK